MRLYFQNTAEDSNEEPDCWIGHMMGSDIRCLVLVNQFNHNLILGDMPTQYRNINQENYNRFDPERMQKEYQAFGSLTHVKIKSSRIQLNKEQVRWLDVEDQDRKILIVGRGHQYNVWNIQEIKSVMPDYFEYLKKRIPDIED